LNEVVKFCVTAVQVTQATMATKKTFQPDDGDTGVATQTKKKEVLQKPPRYRVLFHNDNYTTMEFVVLVLREVFHKSESDAMSIMYNVHRKGVGVAGVYTRDVAETKINKTHQLAKEHEYPLKLSMEPEDE
jgi:ATP-dependent Clp protease adaptor protein ClpS